MGGNRPERQVQPVQNGVLALAIDRREPRLSRAELGYLGVLAPRGERLPASRPGITALLQERVVKITRPQHVNEDPLLRARRIQPHFVQPAHLTREPTLPRRHCLSFPDFVEGFTGPRRPLRRYDGTGATFGLMSTGFLAVAGDGTRSKMRYASSFTGSVKSAQSRA